MNFIDFLKEAFGFVRNHPGNYLDGPHILIASIVTAATLFLGVFLGLRMREKDEAAKTRFILPFAIAMWVLYALRVAMIVSRTYAQGENGWKQLFECDLPLFLCDIQYFALIAICFAKGRIKKVGIDFVICLGILSFAMGVWLNAGTYGGSPWWTSSYFYEMAVHAIPGGISLYIVFSRLGRLRFKDIWATLSILLVFEGIALLLDYANDSNYMFFLRDAGTPFFIFRNWAGDNQPLYSFFVWCGMTAYVLLYYALWELVGFVVGKANSKTPAKR